MATPKCIKPALHNTQNADPRLQVKRISDYRSQVAIRRTQDAKVEVHPTSCVLYPVYYN